MKSLQELIESFDFHDREPQSLTKLVYEIKEHYGNEGLEEFRTHCLNLTLKDNDSNLPENPSEAELRKHEHRERTAKSLHWSSLQIQRKFKNPLTAASEANLRMAEKFADLNANLQGLSASSAELQDAAASLLSDSKKPKLKVIDND